MENDSGLNEQLEYITSADAYRAWLCENYMIGNGHTLTRLECDTNAQIKYLHDMDLPSDTEIRGL